MAHSDTVWEIYHPKVEGHVWGSSFHPLIASLCGTAALSTPTLWLIQGEEESIFQKIIITAQYCNPATVLVGSS